MSKQTETSKGVESAWDFWISQHPISVADIIEEAVKKSFAAWLEAREDDFMQKLAKLVADELHRRGQKGKS